jgi:predicted DNA-binding helix-hairpin-helix protein
MAHDLNLDSARYSVVLVVFFAGYVAMEVSEALSRAKFPILASHRCMKNILVVYEVKFPSISNADSRAL